MCIRDRIVTELSSQGFIVCRRLTVKRDWQTFPSASLGLTFNRTALPEKMKAAVHKLTVRIFIPQPMATNVNSLDPCMIKGQELPTQVVSLLCSGFFVAFIILCKFYCQIYRIVINYSYSNITNTWNINRLIKFVLFIYLLFCINN